MSDGSYPRSGGPQDHALVLRDGAEAFGSLIPTLQAARGELGSVMDKVPTPRKSDAVTYFYRSVAELRAGKLSDLPVWDTILNDQGKVLCSTGRRSTRFAVIADSKDQEKRCFVVQGSAELAKKELSDLAVKSIQSGYRVSGVIQVSDDLMRLLWSSWDMKSGVAIEGEDAISSVQALFDEIGSAAVEAGASDIHLSWQDGKTSVLFRVHGRVRHYQDLTEETGRALVSAAYNTLVDKESVTEGFNERGRQDASIERKLNGRSIRFRYAGAPITGGYDVTLRIIDVTGEVKIRTLEEAGYSVDQQMALHRATAKPSGMIVFMGPTGSGKSTSLASLMTAMAAADPSKIYRSVEEPVEVKMPGVRQTEVPRQTGAVSALNEVLSSILRKDPDVIMIGEIRDDQTAQLAIGAVRSGHLALSSLHTDGALAAFDRLELLGIKRADVASIGLWNALVFQRLVPALCPACKVRGDQVKAGREISTGLARRLDAINVPLDSIFVRSEEGCPLCDGGIAGRTVCAEVVVPTPRMLERIVLQDSIGMWKEWRRSIKKDDPACMSGRTYFEHAIWKMKQGILSPVEVEKYCGLVDEPVFEDMNE
ncbi:TPA: GspE/PulE family protein [Stenotrophomonas maltophilia]